MSQLVARIKLSRPELKPTKAHETDACWDLRADLQSMTHLEEWTPKGIIIQPLERIVVNTGVFVEVPTGFKTQINPRSGLAAKHGITILNSPGTVDASYRGEIKIILYNSDPYIEFEIKDLDRIAQMEFVALQPTTIVFTDVLSDSDRGENGFGSTGVK